jgi:zinc protease
VIAGLARALVLAVLALLLPATATSGAAAIAVQRVVAGDIEAWLVEDHSVPVVSLGFAFRSGAALDPAGKEGLAAMAMALLDEGAGDLDAQAFKRRLDDLAAQLSFNAGLDSVGGSLRTLSRHRDAAFALLGDAVNRPRFDAESVARVRAQLQAALRARATDPDVRASRLLFEALFPDHPYGRPDEGTPDGLSAVTDADLRAFARERLTRRAIVVGVVGDVTAAQLKPLLTATFGALPAGTEPAGPPDRQPAAAGRLVVASEAVPQSAIAFAQRGPKRDDPDFYVLTVLNHILGGGSFTSRLYQQVREERGLAYSVYTSLQPLDHAGVITGYAATANERVAETLDVVGSVWRNASTGDVSAEAVAEAKAFLVGSFPLRFTSSGRIADILVSMQLEHLGIDYLERRNGLIEAVTADEVNRAAQRWLDPDRLTFVVVGKPVGLQPSH